MSVIAARNTGRALCAAARHGREAFWYSRGASLSRFGLVAASLALALAACSGPGAGTTASTAAVAPPPAPVPQRPVLEVNQLASLRTLSTKALIARLGTPDFTRDDPPAQIWQYRGTSCVLDVFLYPEDGEMKVMHAATRDRDRLQAPENGCTPFGPTQSADAGS
jgi:hypothetical protein